MPVSEQAAAKMGIFSLTENLFLQFIFKIYLNSQGVMQHL